MLSKLLLGATFVGGAFAETAVPVSVVSCSTLTPPLGAATESWERALSETERCQDDLQFLVETARWLNEQRRYEEAQLYSERALFLDPEGVPAWIEFAVSQTGLGDPEIGMSALAQAKGFAIAELANLSSGSNPDVERAASLRRWIDEISTLLEAQDRPHRLASATRSLDVWGGYTTNFFGSPTSRSVELTFPEGSLNTLLTPDMRPKKGFQAGVQINEYGLVGGKKNWWYSAKLNLNRLLKGTNSGLASIDVSTEYLIDPPGSWIIGGGAILRYVGSDLNEMRLGGTFSREMALPGNCLVRFGADSQFRQLPRSTGLDGRYVGLTHVGTCSGGWQWSARLGLDLPTHPLDRPGGVYQQSELNISKRFSYGSGRELNFLAKIWAHSDKKGYSPLLSYNSPRRLQGVSIRVEYRARPVRGGKPYFALERSEQRSNIDLFKTNATVLQFGLRSEW